MNSSSLSACSASWQVVKVKCETCYPEILEAARYAGAFDGGGGVVAIVNEPKSYPSHAKYTQTAQAVHTRKNYASHSTHFCVVLATL